MKGFILLILICANTVLAQEKSKAKSVDSFEESEAKLIDYSSIKNVLTNDGLTQEKEKKEKLVKQIAIERKNISQGKYNYPNEDDFWGFMSEYWLVKNAQILSWDFPKPDYGIEVAFKNLLEKLGYFNISFKILIINSPNIVHMGLPGGKNQYIFILSLPFMRSLDLTKVDISLLLLEDFFRVQKKMLINNLKVKVDFYSKSFYKKKVDLKTIEKLLNAYSKVVLEKGFNFQQQYEITKQMDMVLKSDPVLWGAYFRVINKIDKFIKSDLLFKNLLKIFPSPELQLQWLSPKKKNL